MISRPAALGSRLLPYVVPGLLWALSRAWLLHLYWGYENGVQGDVGYYAQSLTDGHGAATLPEYPIPAYALLWLPWRLSGSEFGHLWPALMLTIDAAFLIVLAGRRAPTQPWWRLTGAETFWIASVTALGPITYARFDLIPGMLVGVAILYAVRRPVLAALAVALATGVKYWPILTLPALTAPRHTRTRVLATIAAAGGALVAFTLAIGGWDRLLSPISHQTDRGLQIESVLATPAMIAWAQDPAHYSVSLISHAFEVSGPTVPALLMLSTVWTVAVLALVGLVSWSAWRHLHGDAVQPTDLIIWLCLTATAGWITTSKVLSPQYLLWLMPGVAAGMLLAEGRRSRRALIAFGGILVVAAGLTQLIYPLMYGHLLTVTPESSAVVRILLTRNALLIALTVFGVVECFRLAGDAERAFRKRPHLVITD